MGDYTNQIMFGGESGIRTRDMRNAYTGFRDRRLQPLSHLSQQINYNNLSVDFDRCFHMYKYIGFVNYFGSVSQNVDFG